jgi:glucan 1,3-beta-glucosidase
MVTLSTMIWTFSLVRSATVVFYGLSLFQSAYGLTFGFPYESQKVRGVNIGGWLVVEVRLP